MKSSTAKASLVGISEEIDLAVLKIEAHGLPALSMGDYGHLRQGQVVFAFGSPGGLRNSVTMGVVSAVARQPNPDSRTAYIQTDAPINGGNSGGPLVDIDGTIVGLNTLILTQGGGSEGIGFAIPATSYRLSTHNSENTGACATARSERLFRALRPTWLPHWAFPEIPE